MDLWSCILFFLGRRPEEPQRDDKPKNNQQDETVDAKTSLLNVSYGPVHIYFGSQTGTAASFAKTLGEEASKNGFRPKVIDLIDFNPAKLQSARLAIFLMATHGEGDPTDNAKTFNQWLIDSERTGEELKGLKFTVFGLGDKQYQFYNQQGKRTNEYLEKLGGERVYIYGEGDDNEAVEDDFDDWKKKIWKNLQNVVEVEPIVESSRDNDTKTNNDLPFVLSLTKESEIDFDTYDIHGDGKGYDFQIKQYMASYNAEITLIKELRQKTDDGSTLHIEINNKSVGMEYKTAENLMIFPENTMDVVERALKILNVKSDDVFILEDNKDFDDNIKFKFPFPTPLSVKSYLTKFCDLRSPIRKKQLKDLADFCEKKENKEKLSFLASSDGKIEFEAQVQSRMLGLIDILEKYEVKISLDRLIQVSYPIQPRYYTIASSSVRNPDSVHLCFAMQLDILPNGTKRVGLTSAFFKDLESQYDQGKKLPRVRMSVKESSFHTPTDSQLPVIMVSAGAGVAPFRGFVEEKEYLIKKEGETNHFGEMTLFFGCRARNWDYLYKEELLKYHDEKVIENYFTAFSREKDVKVYVQDVVETNKSVIVKDLFERNGILYICGGLGMGKSVMKKITEFVSAHYKLDLVTASQKVDEMEKNKKIIKELWG